MCKLNKIDNIYICENCLDRNQNFIICKTEGCIFYYENRKPLREIINDQKGVIEPITKEE